MKTKSSKPKQIDCGELLPNVKPTRLADRITKATATVKGLSVNAYGAGIICINPVPQAGGVMSCAANAELIAEAFNITNSTGLSPQELKEQRDEAVKLISRVLGSFALEQVQRFDIKELCEAFLKKVQP